MHPFLALMGASVRTHLKDSLVCVDKDTQAFVARQVGAVYTLWFLLTSGVHFT